MKGTNCTRALNIASIQDLTGEYYVWEEPKAQRIHTAMRKVSVPPIVKGNSRFWTNCVEIADAIKSDTGNVNDNIARAIERQVESREKSDTEPWRESPEFQRPTVKPGRYEISRGDEDHCVLTVDREGNFWDEASGKKLDSEEVQRARLEEITQIHELKVYAKVPIEQCWEETGKAPIRVRWLDINKRRR